MIQGLTATFRKLRNAQRAGHNKSGSLIGSFFNLTTAEHFWLASASKGRPLRDDYGATVNFN